MKKKRRWRRKRQFLGLLKGASMAEVEEIVDPIGVDSRRTVPCRSRIGVVGATGITGLDVFHGK